MQLSDLIAGYQGVPLKSPQRTFLEKTLSTGFHARVTGHASKTIVIYRSGEKVGYINSSTISHPAIFGIQFPERLGGTGFCPDNLQSTFEHEMLTKFGRTDWFAKQKHMKKGILRTYYVVTDLQMAFEYLLYRNGE